MKLMEATCSGVEKNSAIEGLLSAKSSDSDQINKFGRLHAGLGDICGGIFLLYEQGDQQKLWNGKEGVRGGQNKSGS